KTLLLIEVARALSSGELRASETLTRESVDTVADSGLWQHLQQDHVSVADAAAFIGAVSDNLATNVLLRRVGLDRMERTARDLDLETVRLLDRVRDVRGPEDPPALSVGNAADLTQLMETLHAGRAYSETVSRQVLHWLRAGT